MSKFNISSRLKTIVNVGKLKTKNKFLLHRKKHQLIHKKKLFKKQKRLIKKKKILLNLNFNKIFSVLILLRKLLKFYSFLQNITKYFMLHQIKVQKSFSKSVNAVLKFSIEKKSVVEGVINLCISVLQVRFINTHNIAKLPTNVLTFLKSQNPYCNFRIDSTIVNNLTLKTPQKQMHISTRTFEMLTFQKYKLLYLFFPTL